ncbi:MAG: CHAT domain-containing protein [Pyrinomonadaceae bacterium]
MTQVDYRDALWVVTPEQGGGETSLLRSFSHEAALFETTEDARSDNAFTVKLPLSKLVGTRDFKTTWTQDRVQMTEALKAGRKLYHALPRQLTSILDQSADPRPLRLKIYSPQPRITDLPWEWLTDDAGDPIALRSDVRFVRCVPRRFEIPHLTIARPVKVLMVLTNPKDERLLDAPRELASAAQRLVQPDYEMQVCPEPTIEKLKDVMHGFLPHVIHYIGHAGINNGEGNIILHDDYNRAYWMPGSVLSQILPSTTRLICLSTCVTAPNYQLLGLPHLAHASSDLNLPTVVVNRYPLDAQSAAAFWNTFYSALIDEHGNVNEAVHHARRQTQVADPSFADWASFSLVLRDRTGQALNIVEAASHQLQDIQAREFQAQYAARLANDLAQQVSLYDDHITESVRESLEVATRDATELFKIAGDLSKDFEA